MAATLPDAKLLNSLPTLQADCTTAWHQQPPAIPSALTALERTVAEQHLANFELWHAEDEARSPEARDHDIARIKRFIDGANQRRNDLAEACDLLLLDLLRPFHLPHLDAELHSESPGLIVDRLSILALKLYHTQEQMLRGDAPAGHSQRNRDRLNILTEQRSDLAASLNRLWQQVLNRQKRFKLYRQLKMYNDPALNPAVYGTKT